MRNEILSKTIPSLDFVVMSKEDKERLERITRLLEQAQSSRKVPNVVINAEINRKADKFLIDLGLESSFLLFNEFIHLFHSLKRYGL